MRYTMKATDLRVGNLVLDSDNNVREVVGVCVPYTHLISLKNKVLSEKVQISSVNPILITPERLLNSGFIKDDFSKTYVKYSMGNFVIIHDTVNNTFLVDGIKYILVYIEYLHQIQNIYFALTGEELIILF